MIIHCLYCHSPKTIPVTGRKPKFCSDSCKQANYRLRKNNFQRQRISSQLRLLTLRNIPGAGVISQNDLAFRNDNACADLYNQVDCTL